MIMIRKIIMIMIMTMIMIVIMIIILLFWSAHPAWKENHLWTIKQHFFLSWSKCVNQWKIVCWKLGPTCANVCPDCVTTEPFLWWVTLKQATLYWVSYKKCVPSWKFCFEKGRFYLDDLNAMTFSYNLPKNVGLFHETVMYLWFQT